jgi:hypothetical protein
MRSLSVICLLLMTLACAEDTADPWPASAMLEPATLANTLQSGKAPTIVSVAFPVLYRGRHILHAVNAGPGSKPEGIEALKKAATAYPKDTEIVLYCGCCPMVKCPNIRPAYRALIELGFTRIRVLNIPTNIHTDWVGKDYPSEAGNSN